MNTKVYTDEVVAELVADYNTVTGQDYETRNETLEKWAAKLGVSVASVRSKLTQAGVYKKKETSEGGSANTSKAELVAAFAAVTGQDVKSLANASRKDLQVLWDYVRTMTNQYEVDNAA